VTSTEVGKEREEEDEAEDEEAEIVEGEDEEGKVGSGEPGRDSTSPLIFCPVNQSVSDGFISNAKSSSPKENSVASSDASPRSVESKINSSSCCNASRK